MIGNKIFSKKINFVKKLSKILLHRMLTNNETTQLIFKPHNHLT